MIFNSATRQIVLQFQYCNSQCTDVVNRVPTGSLKPDITVAEQEDGTVPQAIVKCILFLQEHRNLPTLYKGSFISTTGLP